MRTFISVQLIVPITIADRKNQEIKKESRVLNAFLNDQRLISKLEMKQNASWRVCVSVRFGVHSIDYFLRGILLLGISNTCLVEQQGDWYCPQGCIDGTSCTLVDKAFLREVS